jgi:hypothetical protein
MVRKGRGTWKEKGRGQVLGWDGDEKVDGNNERDGTRNAKEQGY